MQRRLSESKEILAPRSHDCDRGVIQNVLGAQLIDLSEHETSTEIPGAPKRKLLLAVIFIVHTMEDEAMRVLCKNICVSG